MTRPDDWCHFHQEVGGIPGGRGARLTNVEILNCIDGESGTDRQVLFEKIQQNGLSATMADQRIERLIARGLLVDREGTLLLGDGRRPKRPAAPVQETDGAADPKSESAPTSPRRTQSLEIFAPSLRLYATSETPRGFNELFRAANDVQPIGKGTFTRLIREALPAGKIAQFQGDHQTGRYYFPTELEVP